MEEKNKEEKRIEVITVKAEDLNTNFGNPRKISAKKKQELRESLEQHGDFGIFLIDENNSIIAGNQRWSIIMEKDPTTPLLCKRLIGYPESELRAINIKDNTHNGEWDLDLMAGWTADLNIDLGLSLDNSDMSEKKIPAMEPIRFEKFDYVIIACNNEIDYNELTRKLGIKGKKVKVNSKRSIAARAVWYHKIKAQLIGGEE